jgi:VanZ family protein
MPVFYFWDTLVKKCAHAIGYGLLSLSCWHGLHWEKRKLWLAFLIPTIYALSDEFHQSFVPGRHPSLLDALVIDTGGAAFALLMAFLVMKRNKAATNPSNQSQQRNNKL